jgi:hypothetical protein
VGDLTAADLVIYQLDLRSFATVEEQVVTIHDNNLAGRVTVECRDG